jgi:hypothetical protein
MRHQRLLEERREDDARLCQVSATNTAGTTTASSPAFHMR